MIKFSIITVCFNAGDELISTVRSTLSQTYSNFEIIVKDGYSTDNSVDQLPKDERIRLVVQRDGGIYDAMNQAILQSTGDFLIFMNAGDHFYKNTTLEEIATYTTKNGASMYYGRCFNESLHVYSNSPQKLTTFFCYRSMICHQAMVFDRRYITDKLYDCSYRVSADRELLLYTVVKKKLLTQYIPVVVASYKGSGFCETEKNRAQIAEENLTLKKVYFSKPQQFMYALLYKLTLPGLRKRIVNNPKLVKVYKKAIGLLYRNR